MALCVCENVQNGYKNMIMHTHSRNASRVFLSLIFFSCIDAADQNAAFALKRSLRHPHDIINALAGLSNSTLATGDRDGRIIITDLRTNIHIPLAKEKTPIRALAAFPNGTIASAAIGDRVIKVWHVQTKQCVQQCALPDNMFVANLQACLDQYLMSSYCFGNVATCFDLNTEQSVTKAITMHNDDQIMGRLPNNNIVLRTANNSIKVMRAPEETSEIQEHDRLITAVTALSNTCLATSSYQDGTIKIWDLTTRRCIQTIQCGTAKPTALTALANGSLAYADTANTIHVWAPRTDSAIARPPQSKKPKKLVAQLKHALFKAYTAHITMPRQW
jgi:WD40 repeat protein